MVKEYPERTVLRTPRLHMAYLDFYADKHCSSRNRLIVQAIGEWAEKHLSRDELKQVRDRVEKEEKSNKRGKV
jgi:hypothetical protein